jgi:hypothetical protein
VRIFESVAGFASLRKSDRVLHRLPVAAQTVDSFVGTMEREVGLAPMIEAPDRPAVGVVAALARRAEALVVDVVAAVTIRTLTRRVAEGRGLVTIFAAGEGVEAE